MRAMQRKGFRRGIRMVEHIVFIFHVSFFIFVHRDVIFAIQYVMICTTAFFFFLFDACFFWFFLMVLQCHVSFCILLHRDTKWRIIRQYAILLHAILKMVQPEVCKIKYKKQKNYKFWSFLHVFIEGGEPFMSLHPLVNFGRRF